MSYRHGVYTTEVPTSIVPPARTSAGLPVVFGTAPVHLAKEPAKVNKPILCYSYQEAVEQLGYSSDWEKYTLCEFMKSHFALFAVAPVIFINVFDPKTHRSVTETVEVEMRVGKAVVNKDDILLDSLEVRLEISSPTLKAGKDYVASYNGDGHVSILKVDGGAISSDSVTLHVEYSLADPNQVETTDIIGGVDIETGEAEGLENVNRIFPMFRLVPGQIVAPGWSHYPEVAAIMVAKASNINGHFSCTVNTDVSTEEAENYTQVAEWKNNKNYTNPLQFVCWPNVQLGEEKFHLSTQITGAICKTDAENEDIPFFSPSNKALQSDGAITKEGKEVLLGADQAAYLNGQGIVTALNFIGGWRVWGSRTGAYPAVTDPKDSFIPIRRMMNWIKNTLVLTFWQNIDFPGNGRLIDSIVDSANIWLNGLGARGYILGGRVEFQKDENPITDLMDGIFKFHVYVTPPSPAREISFVLEYDPSYLTTLFAA